MAQSLIDWIGGENESVTAIANRAVTTPAIEILFAQFGDAVLNYCYYRLGSWEDAEDAAQQIFVNALAAFDRFHERGDDPGRSIRSWLFTIAHNEVANRRRFFHRHPVAPLEMVAAARDPGPSPEELAVAADHQGHVLGLISQLSLDQRQVLELRMVGLIDSEIAAVLGRSPGAIRATQFRAVARLRTLLGVDIQGMKGRGDV